MSWLRWILVVCLAAGHAPHSAEAQTPLVKIAPVTEQGGGVERAFFGRVVARETVDLSFQVGGQVIQFPVEEGTFIDEGDLIAALDQEPFELSLEEAKVQNDQAQRTFDRYEQLSGRTVSETNLDDARSVLELAEIAQKDAERALRHATLNAPFDALIASRLVPSFATIGAGTPVVRLHDMSDLRIEIAVPETLFQRAGRDPDVTLFAEFPASMEQFPLEVREFNAETAAIGQTYTITLGMAPPEDLVILPGSSAKVTASLDQGTTQIIIPQSSVLVDNNGGTSVMVFEPAGAETGKVTKVSVTLQPTENGMVQVLDGLEAGTEIVVSGATALADGAEVRRFTGFGD